MTVIIEYDQISLENTTSGFGKLYWAVTEYNKVVVNGHVIPLPGRISASEICSLKRVLFVLSNLIQYLNLIW
jgi:hypothetical protein